MKYLLIIVVAAIPFSCDDEAANKIEAERQIYAELIEQYSATSRWIELFLEVDSAQSWESADYWDWGTPYSHEVADAIARQGDQPIFFLTVLDDIVKDDLGYTARFSCDYTFNYDTGGYYGFLTLRCSEEQVNYLTPVGERSWRDEFAVIATISDFKRPQFSVYNYSYCENDEIQEDLSVEINNTIEVLYGNLIDVRKL